MRQSARLATAFCALLLMACDRDGLVAPDGTPSEASPGRARADSLHCAPAYEATCYTDDELASAVAAHSGAVFIGIAPAGFPHPFAAIRANRRPAWDDRSFQGEVGRLRGLGAQVDREFRDQGFVAARVSPQLAVQLRRLPTTWFIEPQFERHERAGPARNVAASSATAVAAAGEGYPDLRNQQLRDWGVTSIGAPEAWALGFRGELMDAGVLDGEPLESHPDLQAGPPDGLPAIRMTRNFTDEPLGNPSGHATWVVGAIVARDNAFGTVGGAPSARVLAAKVCKSGSCPSAWTLDALKWMMVNSEIDVVNMSLGGSNGTCLIGEHLVLRDLVNAGKVVVTAAGEGGTVTRDKSPYGCYDESDDDGSYDPPGIAGLINVSAHDIRGEPATYTWYDDPGKDISIGGPGGDDRDGFPNENPYSLYVPGQVPVGSTTCGDFSGDGYAPCMGTSMAAPYVSAAVLLIRQKNPTWTPAQVESALEMYAEPWPCVLRVPCGSRTPTYTWFGKGKANASRVLKALNVAIAGPVYVGHNDSCLYESVVSGGTPPYTYYWSAYWSTANTGYYFTTGNAGATATGWGYFYPSYPTTTVITVNLSVTDSNGQSKSVAQSVTMQSSPIGCYKA